jgi:hypothetical protein
MSRVVSVRLSDADDARIKGAAAVTGLSVSAYLKWLVTNGKIGTQSDTEMLLRRFDDLAATIANFGAVKGEDRIVTLADLPARDALVRQLRDRGVPSSTIRQVEAALDELEQEAARARGRVNTNVNTENHA